MKIYLLNFHSVMIVAILTFMFLLFGTPVFAQPAPAGPDLSRIPVAEPKHPFPQQEQQTALSEPIRVRHRDAVAAGEPFLLILESDQPLEAVTAEWLGKQVPLAAWTPVAGETVAQSDPTGKNSPAFRVMCLLAVPLDCKDSEITLRLVESTFNKPFYIQNIRVTQRDYPVQELTVAPKYVTPDPKTTERAQAEARRNRAILAVISPDCHWQVPLLRPVRGSITSEYGFKRVFNGQPRSQHRGVDLRGAAGTPILACADGVVRLAEEQHYSGNFVIIDHGLGVFSMYAHLSAFKVAVGDVVTRGQTVGLVGQTGRVTGPHLHFGFSVLGESVTPEPLMPDFR